MAIRFSGDGMHFETDTPAEAADLYFAMFEKGESRTKKRRPRKQSDAKGESMKKIKKIFYSSDLTMEDLGLKMGYPPTTAGQSVFQFLKSDKPRLDVVQRFASAMGMPVEKLIVNDQSVDPIHPPANC
jgi:hypothetical protein